MSSEEDVDTSRQTDIESVPIVPPLHCFPTQKLLTVSVKQPKVTALFPLTDTDFE